MKSLFSIHQSLLTLACLTALILPGCTHVSPKALTQSHYAYNLAANRSIESAILLNVARAHNQESPSFLNISTISTKNTLTYPNLGLSTTLNPATGVFTSLGATVNSPTGSISPTLVFTPNDGEDFSEELLEPLAIKYLYLVSNSETNLDHVLRIMVKSIGPFLNFRAIPDIHRAGWSYNRIENFEQFTQLLQRIYSYNGYQIYYDHHNKTPKLILPIPASFPWKPSELKLLSVLGYAKPPLTLVFMRQRGMKLTPHVINIQPRSLLNAITFLANSVIDADKGQKTQQPKKINAQFAALLSKHLMNIYVSNKRFNNPYIQIYYRGRWYYIDNKDQTSKESFEIMHIFFNATDIIPKDRSLLLSS